MSKAKKCCNCYKCGAVARDRNGILMYGCKKDDSVMSVGFAKLVTDCVNHDRIN